MIDSYWDLYVAYVNKCVRDNWANDIDPNHYKMEWNHWLPQCLFDDQPVGQCLTSKQHAIASALQTLVFKQNCMFGWHKEELPPSLLELAWPYFCKAQSKKALKLHIDRDGDGKSLHALKSHVVKDEFGRSVNGVRGAERLNAEKDYLGRSVNAVKASEKAHAEKDENGKCVNSLKGAMKLHAEKDENGKSLHAKRTHAKKNEDGKSLNGLKRAASMNSQIWKSTVDGFEGRACVVANHNKAKGWDPKDRIRIG